jgi:hypothetical protein
VAHLQDQLLEFQKAAHGGQRSTVGGGTHKL